MINNMPYRPSDAEVVAAWAAEALRDGRYQLGQALAKVALQAASHEEQLRRLGAVPVPFYGQTRHEEPVRIHPAAAGHLSVINGGGPTGNGDQDLTTEAALIGEQFSAGPAATAILTRPTSLEDASVPSPPQSYRCKAPVVREGVTDVCHAVAYWSTDKERLVHVDMALDATHEPIP